MNLIIIEIASFDVVVGLYSMASLLNPVITLLWKYDYTKELLTTFRGRGKSK